MGQHAMLNTSSADKWMTCHGAVAMEAEFGAPDDANDYADEGTAAHFLASEALSLGGDPVHFLLRTIVVGRHPESEWDGAMWLGEDEPVADGFEVRNTYKVNDHPDMVLGVRKYVQSVRTLSEDALLKAFEQQVPIGVYTGEEGATGTSDFYAIVDKELQVHDLKFGHRPVSPERNRQLMLYALGVLEEVSLSGLDEDLTHVRLFIHQPRLFDEPSEWSCSIDDLRAFGEDVKARAATTFLALRNRNNWVKGPEYDYLVPSEDACRYCRASAVCPKLRATVEATVAGQFENLDDGDGPGAGAPTVEQIKVRPAVPADANILGASLDAVPLIELWIKAVRAEVDRRLREGLEVPSPKGGYKLVKGKAGARYWASPEEAEKVMRSMRLGADVMYDKSLISPTAAEKLHTAGAITARQWPRLEAIIKKPEAGLSVAPMSDKRPAQSAVAKPSDFENLPPTAPPPAVHDDGSDLG